MQAISKVNGLPVNDNGILTQEAAAKNDAFGRLRVSNPVTLFDSKQIFDNAPLFFDDSEVSGTGTTSTYTKAKAMTQMAVSENTEGKHVRQSFMRMNYLPGKSQLSFLTFKMNGSVSGVKSCVGLFDDDNGLFFTDDEGTLKMVTRTSSSGSAVDVPIEQDDWNVDTLDGTGASRITLDVSKTQILIIDFEWLGVGRVRMGFVIDGTVYYVHEFMNANNLTEVYMSTPNLPVRYSIENDGTGAVSTLDHICSSVMSEGGAEDNGALRRKSTGGTATVMTSENLAYAIIGVRLKSTHLQATVKLIDAAIQLQTASEQIEWFLSFNPTVAGTFTYSDVTNSAIQTAIGASANTVTSGFEISGGFIESGGNQAGNAGSGDKGILNALLLGSKIDGTPDEIVLCGRPVGGSSGVAAEGALVWRELS